MGDFLLTSQAQFTKDTLNDQFGPQNYLATFDTIEALRKTFPNFLKPVQNPGPKEKRRQTLRFAAFQLNDGNVFDGTYPAPRFTKWLKWLSWLNSQTVGTFTLDGDKFTGSAGELIVQVLAAAFPHGGKASPVNFHYSHAAHVLKVEATTTPDFKVIVTSPRHDEVSGKDEDDI